MDQTITDLAWNNNELETIAKRSKISIFISIAVSVTLIIVSIVYLSSFSRNICAINITYAVLSIVLAILVYMWCQQQKVQIMQDDKLGSPEYLHYNYTYATATLTGSFVMLGLSVIILIVVSFARQVALDAFISENGSKHEFLGQYNAFLYLMLPLVIINGCCQGMFAFAVFATLQDREYLRQMIYIFNVLFVLSSVLSLYYTKKVVGLDGIQGLCLFSVAVVGLSVLLINYVRKQNFYFVLGSVVFLVLFVFVWMQFLTFREASVQRQTYLDDCDNQLKITHQNWVKSECSCNKYLPDLQCKSDLLVQTWDTTNKEQLKCLNRDCCGILSFQLTKPQFMIAFALLVSLITGFALTVSLLQASTLHEGQSQTKNTQDLLFAILYIVVIITGIFTISNTQAFDYSSIRQPLVIATAEIHVPINQNPVVYPKDFQGVTGCQPLQKLKTFSFSSCDSTTQTCTSYDTAVRVSFLAKGTSILVTTFPNSPNLIFIQSQVGKLLIFSDAQDSDNFLCVQGSFTETADFLNNNVQVCSNLEGAPQSLKIDIFYLPFPAVSAPRRLLPDVSESGQFTLTDAQNTYLSSLVFSDLTLHIQPGGAEILFFHLKTECGNINAIPSRQLLTDNQGEITLYNMVAQTYYMGLRQKGYYTICTSFVLPSGNKKHELSYEMIKRDQYKGQFTVVLQTTENLSDTPEEPYRAQLAGSFVSDKASCSTGLPFQNSCGGMEFKRLGNRGQYLRVSQLVKATYMFYVYFEPTNIELLKLNQMKATGIELNAEQLLKYNNQIIKTNIAPVVYLYANEQDSPIIKYELPPISDALNREPNLTWLSLCIDGKIGDVTQAPIAQFFTYSLNPTYYQRAQTSRQLFPTASICQQFYQNSV